MIPSCILLNPATKADLQAACVQAEAALQAGLVQADATAWAGQLTLGAGAFAIVAALIGWRAIQVQIRAARTDQATQRRHALKSTVYIPAVKALANGFSVVVKLADLGIPTMTAMAGYNERIPDLFAVHLVAELETADKFLKALRGLQELHQTLIPKRPSIQDGRDKRIAWVKLCTAELEKAIPSMVTAVAAMRGELDLPIDEEQYTVLIRDALKAAIDRNEVLLQPLITVN